MKFKFLGSTDLSESELQRFGGKASKLHVLKLAGFDVPAGFILQEYQEDLEDAIRQIGGWPVAVRSSCSLEDLSNASFAGLYETFLNVGDLVELKQKIKECFDSTQSPRVQDYLQTKGLDASSTRLQMSVLVQKMIDPLIAGVLFTYNPINGLEEEFYHEYCEGVGERLVSGHVTPSSCRFNIRTDQIVVESINHEQTKIESSVLKHLVSESRRIQAHFGSPQDIEWAVDKNLKVHILQSRPITTFTYRNDVPEMTNADLKDGGISARVCTPFMFSAYRNALQFSMGDYFKKLHLVSNPDEIKWIDCYYGRVYWNAGAVKEGLKVVPGFDEEAFDRDLGIQKEYGELGPHKTKLSFSSVIKALPVIIGLKREFSDCETMVNQFRDNFEFRDEILKEKISTLSKMSKDDFENWLREVLAFQALTEKNYFRTIYNNSNFQSEFKTALKKMKNYQESDEVELMANLSGVAHLDVQSDLEKLVKKADFFGLDSNAYFKEREQFLKYHYHHGPAELDITVPRWGERKDWVDDLVRGFVHSPKQSHDGVRKVVERLSTDAGVFGKISFLAQLKRSRNFLLIREELRSYSTRAYYLLRIGMLELGKRRKIDPELLFMLDLNEVHGMLSNESYVLPDLSSRLLHYRAYRFFQSPNEFGGSIVQQTSMSKDGSLKGIGCSPGVFTGRARVILDIHATHGLSKNDILVTQFTDPGWTPVLARVGGVVTEVGGLLSHAAVIGREYGIPAILNLNNATKLIKDGSLIKVNGKTGQVEVLEESP